MHDDALSFTVFQARAGDRNPRGMAGAAILGDALAAHVGQAPVRLGVPAPPLARGWQVELEAAQQDLTSLATTIDGALERGRRPLTVMGRCAAGLATLPVVARHHPDACIVWLDAHGDMNTPATSQSGYLGGLVISGACGLWQTGLGVGLALSNVVLVGARDLDPAEQAYIDRRELRNVSIGPAFSQRLARAVGWRRVYVHLDCDVLDPGIVPTEFQVHGGLSLEDLHSVAYILAQLSPIGLEIAEFESEWPDGIPADPHPMIEALAPLLVALRS